MSFISEMKSSFKFNRNLKTHSMLIMVSIMRTVYKWSLIITFYIIHFHIWLSTQNTSKFWKVLSALKGLNIKPKLSYSVKDQPDLGQPLRKKALLKWASLGNWYTVRSLQNLIINYCLKLSYVSFFILKESCIWQK